MSGPFIVVTEHRNGYRRLVNVTHIQQVIDFGSGSLLRFARHAMLDQSVVEVETFEDELHVKESFHELARLLGVAVPAGVAP